MQQSMTIVACLVLALAGTMLGGCVAPDKPPAKTTPAFPRDATSVVSDKPSANTAQVLPHDATSVASDKPPATAGPALPPDATNKYRAQYVIALSGSSQVLRMLRLPAAPVPSANAVAAEMLRYDRVMTALQGSNVLQAAMKEIEDTPPERARREQQLYREILLNTRIEPVEGSNMVRVSYFAVTRDEAREVLDRLVNYYVETSLAGQRHDAKCVRELAIMAFTRAKDELETGEEALLQFQKEHPQVMDADAIRAELRKTEFEIQEVDLRLAARQKQLDQVKEKAAKTPGDSPLRVDLDRQQAVLEKEVESLRETRSVATPRLATLGKYVIALPSLQKEYNRLLREKARAEARYQEAVTDYRRVDSEYSAYMEGLYSHKIISPPRVPTEKYRPSDPD